MNWNTYITSLSFLNSNKPSQQESDEAYAYIDFAFKSVE